MSKEAKVMAAVLIVVVGGLIGLFVISNRPANAPTVSDAGKLVRSDSHKTGSGSVQVVEFGDFQCPACEAAYPNTKQLLTADGSQMTFYFRNFPLPQHQNAQIAAEAAEAAGAQGKYWEMHDQLYDHQNEWAESSNPLDFFVKYAQAIGVPNIDQFKSDIQNSKYSNTISTDQADGNALGVSATPTFYINGKQAPSYDFNTLDQMVKQAQGK